MIRSIREISLLKKDVLVRVDFNVPVINNEISDKSRITASIPTLKYILKEKGRPIILSHFGRPAGQRKNTLSLKKVLQPLERELGIRVIFCEYLNANLIKRFISECPNNSPILLENTRFYRGEERNNYILSEMFSKLGTIYCNDALSVCHRSHSSTVGVAKKLPAYAGLSLERELTLLKSILDKPKRPIVAIVGGAKVSTKIGLLNNLVKRVDHLVIGGGMANTFLLALGNQIGKSIRESNQEKLIKDVQRQAQKFKCKIHLPIDIVCAPNIEENAQFSIYSKENCPTNSMILDIGPNSIIKIETILRTCKTLVWNGPLGAFETPPFDKATKRLSKISAKLTTEKKLLSIAGGGDTLSALKSAGVTTDFTFISTAGGAFLEWLEGRELPGLRALSHIT